MLFEGKEYISSKRASELSDYAQDYIGQLARKGLIDARRVGGLWYILISSLEAYKENASNFSPQQPVHVQPVDVESLVSFDGRDHISAARAAEITGYHQDYVGQLARAGAIISRQVGNRWYVDRQAILSHKKEKDSLLGAVQAQSVGITRGDTLSAKDASGDSYAGAGPFFTYTSDTGDLLPIRNKAEPIQAPKEIPTNVHADRGFDEKYVVPIRITPKEILQHTRRVKYVKSKGATHGKTIYYGTIGKMAAAALTIVIVLSFGFATLKNSSIYGTNGKPGESVLQRNVFTASAAEAIRQVGNFLGNLFVTELVYKRGL